MTGEKSFIDRLNLEPFLTCKDHSVSGEPFEVRYDPDYDLGVTIPQPPAKALSKYYESEAYISHTDSKASLFDKLYHIVKKYTIKQKLNLILKHHKGEKTILDIGCGTGDFLVAAYQSGWKVTGIEPSEKARTKALKKLQRSKSVYTDIRELTDLGLKFDVITMWHVLEHVPDIERYTVELKKLLKPDGTLFVAVPNFKSYDARYYGKFWAAYDVPRHLWHFSKKAIGIVFHKVNMEVVHISPMLFDAFYVSLLSEKYKTEKSHPIRAFWTGFRSNMKAIKDLEYSSLIYIIKNTKF